MADKFTIGLIQDACAADKEQNLRSFTAKVEEAAKKGAQVICLSELFTARYFCSREDAGLFNLAEPCDGPIVSTMQAVAKKFGVVLVVPFFEKRAPGVYHNSTAVIDADGTVAGVYRKMHIPDDPLYYEKFYFTPGDADAENSGFKVFSTAFAKIGVLICWDQWYPEAARITALLGAEVIFYPTAIGWHPAEQAEFGEAQLDAWTTVQRGHAIANGVYVAAANRIGFEETPGTAGLEFFGHSFVSDPFGRFVCRASDQPEILVAECSREHLENVRRNWPFFRDRRIDAYSSICRRFIDSPK